MASAQVKHFEADTPEALDAIVNEFLAALPLSKLIDMEWYLRGVLLGCVITFQED